MQKTLGLIAVAAIIGAIIWYSNSRQTGPEDGAPFLVVMVPELTGEAKEGETLFLASCAACHGINAAGRGGLAPPLVNTIYRNKMHADVAFWLAVKNGVRAHHWRFGSMPPVAGVDEAAVTKITAYVRALQRENGIN
jgi:mono/diheme cytochrome c family protein